MVLAMRKKSDADLRRSMQFDGIVIWRERSGKAMANVPHVVTYHSPTGYEFGYGGSGPADLALNIVENILTIIGYNGERVKCSSGECFAKSLELHQDFKWKFIAPLNQSSGGVIKYQEAHDWVLDRI